jgi:hypothetical protein
MFSLSSSVREGSSGQRSGTGADSCSAGAFISATSTESGTSRGPSREPAGG